MLDIGLALTETMKVNQCSPIYAFLLLEGGHNESIQSTDATTNDESLHEKSKSVFTNAKSITAKRHNVGTRY